MAGHFRAVTGEHLSRILELAGFAVDWRRSGHVQLSRGGECPIGLSTAFVIPQKRVRAVCKIAGLSAAEFDRLSRAATVAPGRRSIH